MIFKQFNEANTRTLKARGAHLRAHAPRLVNIHNTNFNTTRKERKMKTKLLTLAIIAVIALNVSGALAATCEGGTLQTGENGHVYCQSNNQMNWWSAYTWCEAQGRHLASMYEVCPTWDGSTGGGKICNLNSFPDNGYNWSSTALESNYAFAFTKSSIANLGSLNASRSGSSYCRALCY